jgi:large subunit ribosomal protein L4
MIKVDVYNQTGQKTDKMDLNPGIFGLEIKPELVQQAVVTQLKNRRRVIAHTKGRAEVSGGGRKPWRQKGTGRARHGSIRSPLWVGGGVVFGPRKDRNFSIQINKKAKRKALLMVISDKVKENKFIVVDEIKMNEYKTRDFLKLIGRLPLKKTILTVLPNTDIKTIKSANILPYVDCIRADSLNVYDILAHEYLLLPKESVAVIEKTYLK